MKTKTITAKVTGPELEKFQNLASSLDLSVNGLMTSLIKESLNNDDVLQRDIETKVACLQNKEYIIDLLITFLDRYKFDNSKIVELILYLINRDIDFNVIESVKKDTAMTKSINPKEYLERGYKSAIIAGAIGVNVGLAGGPATALTSGVIGGLSGFTAETGAYVGRIGAYTS